MQWKIFRTSLLQSRDQWNPKTAHSHYDRGDGVVNVCEQFPSLPGLWIGKPLASAPFQKFPLHRRVDRMQRNVLFVCKDSIPSLMSINGSAIS